jgi:hypothetical protein
MPDLLASTAGGAKTVPQSGYFNSFPLPAKATSTTATITIPRGTTVVRASPTAMALVERRVILRIAGLYPVHSANRTRKNLL